MNKIESWKDAVMKARASSFTCFRRKFQDCSTKNSHVVHILLRSVKYQPGLYCQDMWCCQRSDGNHYSQWRSPYWSSNKNIIPSVSLSIVLLFYFTDEFPFLFYKLFSVISYFIGVLYRAPITVIQHIAVLVQMVSLADRSSFYK